MAFGGGDVQAFCFAGHLVLQFFHLQIAVAKGGCFGQAGFAEVFEVLEGVGKGAVGGGFVAVEAGEGGVLRVGPGGGVLREAAFVFFQAVAVAGEDPEGDGGFGDHGAAGGGAGLVVGEPVVFDFLP